MELPLQASKNYGSATQDSDRVCYVEQKHQHKTQIHYFYCFTVHFCSLSFSTNLCTHIYY